MKNLEIKNAVNDSKSEVTFVANNGQVVNPEAEANPNQDALDVIKDDIMPEITPPELLPLPERGSSDDGAEAKRKRGRPKKTDEQREAESKNLFQKVIAWLKERFQFRYNTITEQVEIMESEEGNQWEAMDDRKENSLLTDLHAACIRISKMNLVTYICSEMVAPAYNPIESYAKGLAPWKPSQKDYIAELFSYLGLRVDEQTEFLLMMAKKWYVWTIAVAIGLDTQNQLMLVLSGEKEGIGKTSFVEKFLPQALRRYIHRIVQISTHKDKDELLAMARNMICFLDEILLNSATFNKLKNYVGGAGATAVTERTHFGHFASSRKVHASFVATTNKKLFLPETIGNRRFIVLPVTHRGKDYKSLPQERAFAQGYYLATHPKKFPLEITQEEIEMLKEINQEYAIPDYCTTVIPTVLRQPNSGEQAQAVYSPEIIEWLTQRYGPNKEFIPQKVSSAMQKLGFEPHKTKKGMRYLAVPITQKDLKLENENLANEIVTSEAPF